MIGSCIQSPQVHRVWQWKQEFFLLFNHEIMSNSLQPHGLQYTKLFCPPLLEFPLLLPFSPASRSFPMHPSIRVFPMSQLFTSGGQNIRASASISPSNEYSRLISFGISWYWCSSLCFVQLQIENKDVHQIHTKTWVSWSITERYPNSELYYGKKKKRWIRIKLFTLLCHKKLVAL